MILVRNAEDSDGEEWNSFLSGQRSAHHSYSWEWREIISRTFGHEPYYLLARREGKKICGLLPLFFVKSILFGKALISVPYLNAGGILSDDPQASTSLLNEANRLGSTLQVKYIELRQRHEEASLAALELRKHKAAMILQLQRDPEALFESFPGKLRSQIRRPTKSGITAEALLPDKSSLDQFYSVFSKNMHALGTPVYPRSFFNLVALKFADKLKVILAQLEKNTVAAGITLGLGESVEIPWASSLREFNNLSPNMLLYWKSLEAACKDGYKYFDFGRSTLDSPAYKFKAQWGTQPAVLHWYYSGRSIPDVNPHSPKFAFFVRAWKALPQSLANKLGPWLTRSLP